MGNILPPKFEDGIAMAEDGVAMPATELRAIAAYMQTEEYKFNASQKNNKNAIRDDWVIWVFWPGFVVYSIIQIAGIYTLATWLWSAI